MKYIIDSQTLTDIANGVRYVKRDETTSTPPEMAEILTAIPKAEETSFPAPVPTSPYKKTFTVNGLIFYNTFREFTKRKYWNAPPFVISELPNKVAELAEGEKAKGVEDGKQAEHDAFWEQYQRGGATNNEYSNAFYTSRWNDDIYKPKYDIVSSKSFNNLFAYSKITDTLVTIDATLLTSSNKQQALFSYATGLKTIRLIRVAEHNTYSDWFLNCTSLESVFFDGVIGNNIDFRYSTKLNKDSINDIFSHLSVDVTGKTLTLSLDAVNTAYETMEGEGNGSSSIEWDSLCGEHSNWNISLV